MRKDNVTVAKHRSPYVYLAGLLLALVSCQQVDAAANLGDNARVLFNSGTGRGNPNQEGGHRRECGFFVPVKRHSCAFFMAGRGGEPSGCRSLLAGFPHPAMCLPPQPWKVGGGFNPKKEATMPSVALRAFRALFPVYAIPVSTLPTLSEARALAALLVSRGKRVAIQPAAQGFAVSEVTA